MYGLYSRAAYDGAGMVYISYVALPIFIFLETTNYYRLLGPVFYSQCILKWDPLKI